MVALHLPYAQLHEWIVGMEANTFHAIPGCITIGCASPPAYSPTIVHTPLGGSDTFFLWRTKEAPRPTHNVFAIGRMNPRGDYRKMWTSFQVVPSGVYKKSSHEILRRVDPLPIEQCDKVNTAETSFFRTEADLRCEIPEFVNQGVAKDARSRRNHWRKEQISQGVLTRILSVLGRIIVEQVRALPLSRRLRSLPPRPTCRTLLW